jgi:two-component sensor histidine kinase
MDQIADLRVRILEKVVLGEPADATLDDLCRSVQDMIPDAVVGVTILDRAARTFESAIFPSIPAAYAEALKGARVAERPGSCALAVYRGTTVTSDDIATDARFQEGWKALHVQHGIASIQSRPVCVEGGPSLGTLVVAFRKRRQLHAVEESIVEAAVRLASMALRRRREELQNELLVGELQHRTRNLFATVGAVAVSTIKAYSDPKAFRTMFEGRLSALSRAHSLTVETAGMDLRNLLTDVLVPYSAHRAIAMDGPAFTLSPAAAVAFSMATHELATNAAKYGALSIADGRLDVRWDIARDESGEDVFELQWRESGGPIVSEPSRSGFGRFAIERSLAHAVDGTVALDFLPAGLVCTIRAPVSDRLGERGA